MSLLQQLRALKVRRQENKTQQEDGEANRRQRYSEAWLKLMIRIDGWLANLVREELVQVTKTEQDGETVLHIDVIDPERGVIRTSLVPISRRAVGVEGRLDARVCDALLFSLLLFDNGHWELFDTSRRLVTNRAFTAMDIESLLETALVSEALK